MAASRVTPLLVDLPVGEADAVRRLAQVSRAMGEHKRSGHSVSADALVAVSGFAPPTLHALGARAVNGLARRMFSLVVTNVPGPQVPVYAAGARLTEMFPLLPLAPGQAVSIGLTSYDGGVYYGVNGDWDAMPDVDALAALLEAALAELVAASPPVGGGAGPGARPGPRWPAPPGRPPTGPPHPPWPALVMARVPRTAAGDRARRRWRAGLRLDAGCDVGAGIGGRVRRARRGRRRRHLGRLGGARRCWAAACRSTRSAAITRASPRRPTRRSPIRYEGATGGALPPRPGWRPGSPQLLLDALRHPLRVPPLVTLAALLPTGRGTLQPVRELVAAVAAEAGFAETWPTQPRPWVVAADYRTGRRVVFGRESFRRPTPGPRSGHRDRFTTATGGGPAPRVIRQARLADAVSASCSIPAWYPPVVIDGVPYIDGGTLSNASVDVLRGAPIDEVYVFAPMASVHADRAHDGDRAGRAGGAPGDHQGHPGRCGDTAYSRHAGVPGDSRTGRPRGTGRESDGPDAAHRGARDGAGDRGGPAHPPTRPVRGLDARRPSRSRRHRAGTGVRVFLPSTTTGLTALVDDGTLGARTTTAFAVTPGLREWYVDDDLEELEYAAMLEAARASLRLLDADPAAARRRVVLAAEVPDDLVTVRDDLDRGVVQIAEPVPLSRIVSLHVDDPEAETAVAAAAQSITAADLGEPAAQDVVDDAEGYELCWYATQEIAAFVELL